MGYWAERMITQEVQEESRIKQEKIASQAKTAQEKKQAANVLAMYSFLNSSIDNEWFWRFIAYAYFVGKTLGLLILIGLLFFGKLHTILFISIFLCCCYFNLKLYKKEN